MNPKILNEAHEILNTWSKETLIADILSGMKEQELIEFVEDNKDD